MLDLPPTVVERDGEEVVVDQAGHELVLRRENGKTTTQKFHEPDVEAAREGEQRAACLHGQRATAAGASDWMWRRKESIDRVWSLCGHCASDVPEQIGDPGGSHGTSLAHKLETSDDIKAELEAALDAEGGAD